MRKILLFIALIIFGGAFFFLGDFEKKAPSTQSVVAPDSEFTSEGNGQENVKIDPEVAKLHKTFSPEEVENLKHNHAAALAANQNVVFYGKCIDQDGNPISDVFVKAKLTKMRKSMSSVVSNDSFKYYENLEAQSDESGRFEFIDEGSYLLLESMEKEGYLEARGAGSGFQFGQILYGSEMAGMHEPDPLSPVIFVMWKKGDGSEAMVTKRVAGGTFGADVNIEKSAMDRPYYFDLKNGKKTVNRSSTTLVITGKNAGNSYWDPEKLTVVKGKKHYSWSFRLSIPSGGLMESEDLFLFRPPESGYRESFEFSVSDDLDQWVSDVCGKKFYFITPEGNYGAFVFDARSSAQGDLRFFFNKVFYNPTGEPDLEHF